jgi:hypothetical protein
MAVTASNSVDSQLFKLALDDWNNLPGQSHLSNSLSVSNFSALCNEGEKMRDDIYQTTLPSITEGAPDVHWTTDNPKPKSHHQEDVLYTAEVLPEILDGVKNDSIPNTSSFRVGSGNPAMPNQNMSEVIKDNHGNLVRSTSYTMRGRNGSLAKLALDSSPATAHLGPSEQPYSAKSRKTAKSSPKENLNATVEIIATKESSLSAPAVSESIENTPKTSPSKKPRAKKTPKAMPSIDETSETDLSQETSPSQTGTVKKTQKRKTVETPQSEKEPQRKTRKSVPKSKDTIEESSETGSDTDEVKSPSRKAKSLKRKASDDDIEASSDSTKKPKSKTMRAPSATEEIQSESASPKVNTPYTPSEFEGLGLLVNGIIIDDVLESMVKKLKETKMEHPAYTNNDTLPEKKRLLFWGAFYYKETMLAVEHIQKMQAVIDQLQSEITSGKAEISALKSTYAGAFQERNAILRDMISNTPQL